MDLTAEIKKRFADELPPDEIRIRVMKLCYEVADHILNGACKLTDDELDIVRRREDAKIKRAELFEKARIAQESKDFNLTSALIREACKANDLCEHGLSSWSACVDCNSIEQKIALMKDEE